MPPIDDILLVYDRQCPACDYYCTGLDIDQGMVLKVGDNLYYGPDAIHVLSLMGTNTGVFNRLTHWCFKSRSIARVLYPVLRSCRNLLLKILGKTKINNLGTPGNDRF